MKFIHLSDLHIGKTLNAFSLLGDQEYALSQVLDYVKSHTPDAVLIAGDIYDKQAPPPEAVRVFDAFLTALAALGPVVMIVSGNHDSPERLGFASGIMSGKGVHLYGVFDGKARVVTLSDAYGDIRFHILPHIRPADVRRFYAGGTGCGVGTDNGGADDAVPDEWGGADDAGGADDSDRIMSYHDAVSAVIGAAGIDAAYRNVLIAHQFIVSEGVEPERSESEREMIGGVDRIDAITSGMASNFDYVALGHLHGPQRVGAEHIRYSGSLLKYSFSECFHNKCALLVEIREKGELGVTALPIKPLRDMRRVRGRLVDLLSTGAPSPGGNDDYLHVILTDEDDVYDAMNRLRTVYPNVMRLDYDNARTHAEYDVSGGVAADNMTPLSMFEEFFIAQNGAELDDEQRKAVTGFLNE